ncbi:hypothetical protein B0A48_06952 [Cryoendolithus antarcticus]|uniref:Prenylcysteine lyase domain-containing protein n=1 Tax=Cryoendolithus antarcticus TaxID=1507870 RepID=A0A1V8TAA6_9PEZI|nr:hypothetical protein B0A48_06952 [Cryoendolithus antarcticus]
MRISWWTSVIVWQFADFTRGDQVVLQDDRHQAARPRNVAIVGAGAAGASSAYHLARYAAAVGIPVNITIFERNDYVGGRTTTVNAYNSSEHPIELGGSVFIEKNRILFGAAKAFNLTTSSASLSSRSSDIPGAALGVWDGEHFVVTQNNEGSWWDTAKLLYKYGLAPIRTLRLMRATMEKFFQMYDAPIFPFNSLTQAASDVGLLAVTSATGEQLLRESNIGRLFAREIIQASTRVNYAQNLDHIHALETMVCMAVEGAMAVEGGNWQIFDRMIEESNATLLLNTPVKALDHDASSGTYTIHTGSDSNQNFSALILAHPFQYSSLSPLPATIYTPAEIDYVTLHVTLFTSPRLLSPLFFGLAPDKPAPHAILTTLPEGEHAPDRKTVGSPGFYSVSLLRQVTSPTTGASEFAYKIFSPAPPTPAFIARLLGVQLTASGELKSEDVTWLYRKEWQSYPYEIPRRQFERIRLGEGAWYTAGIEGFVSTMETSALMGKNVARLVVDQWIAEGEGMQGHHEV